LETRDFLIKLCEASSVSGSESEAAEIIREAFSEYLSDVSLDNFGNVTGVKKGRGKGKLMLAAHMDEIGLMVTDIDEKGFIRFTTIGGIDSRVLPAQEVIIHGKEKVFGVIGLKPPHITAPEEKDLAVKIEDLVIDTGYSSERINKLVSVGNVITIKSKAKSLKNNLVSAKSMDDSVGVAVLYSTLKQLKDVSHDLDVYFVATVQEEVGIRGAITSSYNIEPDIGIAVDVGFAKTPELDETKTIEMGKGPAIAIGPGIHPSVYELLKKAAKDANLKHQIEVLVSRTGTDADSIQISRKGVAAGVISVPLKYMHTPVETVELSDIEQSGRLLAEFVRIFNDTELESALCL
jgi:endoglucanase